MAHEWQNVDRLAAALEGVFPEVPEVAMVLGSGLGEVADHLTERRAVSGEMLPMYPVSTVAGHAGEVCQGRIGGRCVMILSGRVHLYEGHSAAAVARPVRAAVTRGTKIVLLTNAAGGINTGFSPGDLMIVEDHLNLTGTSVLLGPNDATRGPRFPDMSKVYDEELSAAIVESGEALGTPLQKGVYAGMLGPAYETPAEVKMLSMLGADAVGMSTVQEAMAARHMGARVAAISCITNAAAGIAGTPLDHREVEAAGADASKRLVPLLIRFLEQVS